MSGLTSFANLPWQSRFVERLSGDLNKDNFTRQVRAAFYSEVTPTPVRQPKLLVWSDSLAAELGIARPSSDEQITLDVLSGNRVLSQMRPYAARYGGHQFGNWAGQLGDGRAITLGEVLIPGHGVMEFQLKGAGPTPYSRRADGRAVLRSSVREFLCSEAMHFLGVPTTRALSLVST
ncbi:MAG: protein adenylyltransferase SelO family protein, partial [Bdellovibrionia bacterium]